MSGRNARKANGAKWRALQRRVRARMDPCALCGEAIDYGLPPGDPMSFTIDHIVPISRGGGVYDPENCQAAHLRCNQAKGARMQDSEPKAAERAKCFPLSRSW